MGLKAASIKCTDSYECSPGDTRRVRSVDETWEEPQETYRDGGDPACLKVLRKHRGVSERKKQEVALRYKKSGRLEGFVSSGNMCTAEPSFGR
jgi:hypothetical protein